MKIRKSAITGETVCVCIRDGMLLRAVCNMLSDAGYEVLETDKPPLDTVTVCDDTALVQKNKSAVFIGYECPTECTHFVLRPFTEDELVCAVDKIFESTKTDGESGISFDKKRQTVTFYGRKSTLSEKEAALLALLYESRGKAVSDAEIISRVWKNETVKDSNIAAVYINYLRKKLADSDGNSPIIRIRGTGYMLK